MLLQNVIQKVNKVVFKTKKLNLKRGWEITATKLRKQAPVGSYSEMT